MKAAFNFFRDHIVEYLFIAILFASVFFIAFSQGSYANPNENPNIRYAEKVFDQSYVHKIEIEISEDKLDDLRDEPKEKLKYLANIIIDGERFDEVAISTRGNASLFGAAEDVDNDRYSYKINFQKYGQPGYYGLDKLLLNNLRSDPSCLKDYVVYDIARKMGIMSPLASFTTLYINGELQGLYGAVEELDDSFLARNKAEPGTVLYKPEAFVYDLYKRKQYAETLPEDKLNEFSEMLASPEIDYGGSDLVYHGDNAEAYTAIFDNAVSKISQKDKQHLIESIKALEPAEVMEPSNYWNIDSIAKYLALNSMVMNFDSYIGKTSHNYFILSSQKGNTLLPWDYDFAFENNDTVINWPIDDLISIEKPEDRPIWNLIKTHDEYLEKYHNELQNLLDNYISNGDCIKKIDDTANLIREYVRNDPTTIHPFEDFESGVEDIKDFILARSDNVQKQLWGLSPRIKERHYLEEELNDFNDLEVLLEQ